MPLAPRLTAPDWLRLLVAALLGGAGAFLLQLLLLRTLLEPQLLAESELRITRSVRLLETSLLSIPETQLPAGVITRHQLSEEDDAAREPRPFDAAVLRVLRDRQGIEREMRRDVAPLQDPWGATGSVCSVRRASRRCGFTSLNGCPA